MTSPPPGNDSLGQEVFGPYLVYERLGVGGMATVHRAKERGIEGFERIVALKRLLPHLAEDASFVKSFVREAKLASMLQHANVVQLYELGRVGTVYFISMEYIDGRDVRRILRQARKVSGPPNINVTVALLLQLCDALEYAHTRLDESGEPLGLVHRDVSPSNLLVTRSGHLKVIDFGIAKAQSQQLRTQTGRVKGKLAYMAPEAIAGKDLDARSDIFSVGVIAHELLTARPLFASKNEYQTLVNVQRSDILPPSAFNQAVPPELDAIVLKALARDPDERYHHAAEMRDDLHGVRIRYNLSATNREVQTWSEWAFSLEAPGGNFSGPAVTDSLAGVSRSPSPLRTPLPLRPPTDAPAAPPRRAGSHGAVEEEDADVAWGGQEAEVPVVLDDVPDHSGRHPVPAAAVAAASAASGPHALAAQGGHVDARSFSADDPASASTLVGMGAPARRAAPSTWPHGSSNDAVGGRRPRTSSIPVATPATDDHTVPNPATDAADLGDGPAFGAALVERRGGGAKVAILGLLAAAAIAVGVYWTVGRDRGPAAAPAATAAATQPGTLKFIVEPADATIKIAGMEPHQGAGAPWSVQLEPGVVQIKVSRDGHQSWETSVELSAGETQTIRVVLGAADANANMATLAVDSQPQGMTVLLDGQELPQKTPVKLPVPPGQHTVTLRQHGVVQWRHSFVAEAGTLHEFNPSMSDLKQKEREEREARDPRVARDDRERTSSRSPRPAERPAPVTEAPGAAATASGDVARAALTAPATSAAATTEPATPTAPAEPRPGATAPTAPTAPGATAAPTASTAGAAAARPAVIEPAVRPTAPAAPTAPTAPVNVPPNAVKRTSGDLPRISTIVRPGQEVPKTVAVKVCIDGRGAVTSVQIYKLTGDVAEKLAAAIRGWRYTPHTVDGRGVPACFANTFQLK